MQQFSHVVLDVSSLATRCWYPVRELQTTQGTPNGMEFGFFKAFLAWVRKLYPAKFHLVFDGYPQRIYSVFPAYKQNRKKSPEREAEPDWRPRLDRIREALKALVPCYYHPQMEADDLIAWRVSTLTGPILILSSDRDLQQLVQDGCVSWCPFTEEKVWAEAEVLEEWGVPASKLALLRAISGDSSDSIPGIPRVLSRDKQTLVNEVSDLDSLIEKIQSGTLKFSKNTQKKLLEGVSTIKLNYEIMQLRRSWDVDIEKSTHYLGTGNRRGLRMLMQDLELDMGERQEWELLERLIEVNL